MSGTLTGRAPLVILLAAGLACGGGGDAGSGPSGGDDPGPFEGTWVVTFSDLIAGPIRCILPSATMLLHQPATSLSGGLTADGDGYCDHSGVIYQGSMQDIAIPAFEVPNDTLRILQSQVGFTLTGRVVGDSMGGAIAWRVNFGGFTGVPQLVGTWSARRQDGAAGTGTPVRLRYAETALIIAQGDSLKALVTARDPLGNIVTVPGFSYSIFDPARASVSPAGFMRAAGPLGIFRARTEAGGMRAEAAVVVVQWPSALVVTPESLVMERYRHRLLTATVLDYVGTPMANIPVTYAASPDGLIEVLPGTSIVHTLGPTGTTSVMVSAARLQVVVPVQVNATPAQVILSPSAITLAPGASMVLTVSVRDSAGITINGAPVTWSSTAPAVADVAQDGTVTAVSVGSTTITATAGPGVSTSVGVTVQ